MLNVRCSSFYGVKDLQQFPQQRGHFRQRNHVRPVAERAFRSRMGFHKQTIGARRQRGAVRASVRSAGPLSAEDSRRLRKCLEAFSGCVVEMEVSEEPELLGGVAVRLGDWVMDSSLKDRLQSLKEAIGGD